MQKKPLAILALVAVLVGAYVINPIWFYRIYNVINPPDPTDPADMRRLNRVPPKDWYNTAIDYYKEGYDTNWANERGDMNVSEEMKDENNKFGYLIRDLDGDGVEELLIGIIDDKPETRFTDLYIWHFDFGARRTFNAGSGYYMYLCEDNIIRYDSWRGKNTADIQYMKYNGEDNSMSVPENLSPEPTPQKIELTPLN